MDASTLVSRHEQLVATLLDGLTDDDIFGIPSSIPSVHSRSQPSTPKRRRLSSPTRQPTALLPLSSTTKANRIKAVTPVRHAAPLPPAPPPQEDEYSALFEDFPLDDDWEADLLLPPLVSLAVPALTLPAS
jgi:hypothetical protein